jgi:hypothetical protein
MRKFWTTAAALVAAVVVLWFVFLPPRPVTTGGAPDPQIARRTVAGAFHVHSLKSDGSESQDAIAAAAARAGLRFVVFTDHGDATREPSPPRYSSGVLCVDAVEISTNQGHYIALGLPKAPYRLGGDARAVVEDVRRLGGFGIVAHPDSPKPELEWREWTARADGVEWLNADTAWRERSWPRLARMLSAYFVRPGPALASILDRPGTTLRRWDEQTRDRQIVAVAGLDAHGGIHGGYEASFRSFSLRAILERPLSGDAASDAGLLLGAVRGGRVYTAIDGLAAPAWLEFSAARGAATALMGSRLAGDGPVTFTVETPRIAGASIVLLRDGRPVAEGAAGSFSAVRAQPGAYRVEVRLPGGRQVPWILGNPVYVGLAAEHEGGEAPAAGESVAASLSNGDWHVEHSPMAQAALVHEQQQPGMTFQLPQGREGSEFAALAAPLPSPVPAFQAIRLDVTSAAPTRLSVQIRSATGERWRASFVASPESHPVEIPARDLVPAEQGSGAFDPSNATSILLVIDLVNSTPGASGKILIRDLALVR